MKILINVKRHVVFLCSLVSFSVAQHICIASVAHDCNSSSTSPRELANVKVSDTVADFDRFLEQHASSLSASDKAIFYQHLAVSGHYLDTSDFWEAIKTPEWLVQAIPFMDEPYSPNYIKALAKALPGLSDPQYAFDAAVVLYRYKDPSGSSFLDINLKQGDIDAAAVFATAKDESKVSSIVTIMRADTRFGWPPISPSANARDAILNSTSTWKQPDIADTYLFIFNKFHSKSYFHGVSCIGFGHTEVKDAIGIIYSKSDPEQTASIYSSIALCSLNGSQVLRKNISDMLLNGHVIPKVTVKAPRPITEIRSDVLTAIRIVGDKTQSSIVSEFVSRYVNKDTKNEHATKGVGEKEISPDLAVQGVEVLSALNDVSAAKTAQDLLVKISHSQLDPVYWIRAAHAAWDLGVDQSIISSVMGPSWVKREAERRKLRPLPIYLTPADHFNPYLRD